MLFEILNIIFYDKKFIFYIMAMKLILLLLTKRLCCNIQYLVYYIIHITYKTNDKTGTAMSISDIYNDILHNLKNMKSFGGHLANYICKVLVAKLIYFHLIFFNI